MFYDFALPDYLLHPNTSHFLQVRVASDVLFKNVSREVTVFSESLLGGTSAESGQVTHLYTMFLSTEEVLIYLSPTLGCTPGMATPILCHRKDPFF